VLFEEQNEKLIFYITTRIILITES
jgi:hypothetical protein